MQRNVQQIARMVMLGAYAIPCVMPRAQVCHCGTEGCLGTLDSFVLLVACCIPHLNELELP